ncbi:MAG: hypothetical protein SWO11_19085 [Thermodesulfobacteriota bacterium]|nr:hypothetical protein [Thermodesulfobacteriota bacterium]
MQSEDRIRVQHILDEAGEACHYIEDITFDKFVTEGKTVRAVIRCIKVIGEAASKISMEFRKDQPDMLSPRWIARGLMTLVSLCLLNWSIKFAPG